jgi:hypothetical protein
MTYTAGEYSATALIAAGLPRHAVVASLEHELGLSEREANAAWLRVTLRTSEVPAIRRTVRELAHA